MTPTIFCEHAKKESACLKNIIVKEYDKEWMKEMKMGFLYFML